MVLFDTLLDRYSRDEVRVVVAHELAHVRHRDVPRGVLVRRDRRSGRGARGARLSWALDERARAAGALPALALAAAIVSRPVGVVANRAVAGDRAPRRRFSLG